MQNKISAIVLAAGKGTRIGSHLPKVLYPLAGKPMISYVLDTIKEVGLEDIYVVTGYRSEDVQASINRRAYFVYQPSPLGTGHAVDCALKEVPPDTDTVMLVNGDDSSFYSAKTIKNIIDSHQSSQSVITMVTVNIDNPQGLGRVIRDDQQEVIAIREEVDASDSEKKVKEVVIGFYIFNVDWIRRTISAIKPSKSGEIYIVDAIAIAKSENKTINVFNLTDPGEWIGVNTKEQLELANEQMIKKIHDNVKNSKNILFDLDDTILSTNKLKEAIEAKIVYTVKQVFNSKLTDEEIKSKFWTIYADHKNHNGWVSTPELGQLLADEYGFENGAETFKRLLYTLPFKSYIKPGATELFSELKGKMNRIVLAYGDLVYQPLKISVFNDFIDNYHVYEKLDDKMLTEIGKIYQNTEVLVVEDKLATLEKFSLAVPHIKTIWISGGPYQSDSKYIPDYTVNSISELAELLRKI